MGGFSVPQIETSGSGTIATLGGVVTVTVPFAATMSVNITGTWIATLTFEGSVDGTSFFPILASAPATGVAASTTSANGAFIAGIGGYQAFRVRASTYTSGTATVMYNADTTPNVQSSGQIKGATDGTGIGNVSDRLKMDDCARTAGVNAEVTIGTTAVEAKADTTALTNRRYLVLRPKDNDIYWGFSNGVTTTSGTKMFKDELLVLPFGVAVWLIASASNKKISVSEAS